MHSLKDIAQQMELFSAYLKKNGLKMTRQREAVVESFLRTDGHLSTDELYELVKKKDKKVGFTMTDSEKKDYTRPIFWMPSRMLCKGVQ